MAINLNPGADKTLVNVAYRAATADTPADYSKTLEKTAESYGKTMEASSKMWGGVASIGAAIGGEMVKNAQELTNMVAKGTTLNPEDAKMFYDEIYGVKDELKALGTFSGQFGDRETRQKRAQLKIKQQELFADIDNAVENLKVGADAIAAGTFDGEVAGLKDKEKINAIIKSNLKNNVTENGKNYAKLSRDENGELIYTLYDGETGLPTMEDGEPQTMTLKQFNESIATNVKDGGAMLTAFGSLTEGEANAGNGALNSTYDPERKQMTLNKLDALLGDKPVNLKRAMRTPIGYSNTSFHDDLTSQSTLSAELYSALVGVTGDESGELTGSVVDGIEDIDNSGGISAEEIRNSGNYNVLVGNITGLKDAKVSKEFFKEYAVKEMEEAYKYGHRKKAPVPNSFTTDDKDVEYGGWGRDSWTTKGTKDQAGAYITWRDAESRRNDLSTFRDVGGKHGYYTWNKDLGKNGMYVDERGDEFTMYNVADREGLIKTGEGKGDFNPTRNAAANKEGENLNKGLASPSMLQSTGSMGSQDNAAANELNNTFKFTSAKNSDYFFVPYSDVYGEIVGADNVFSNDIMLIDGSTGKPIRDGKKVRRFGTGKDYSANDLKWINDFLGEYARKQQQADDITTYTQN